MITQKQFSKLIEAIEKQEVLESKITKFFEEHIVDTSFFPKFTEELRSSIISFLEETFNDKNKLICWYLYEDVEKTMYVDEKEIDVSTNEKFYNFLVKNHEAN